jgi:hypothetical protein
MQQAGMQNLLATIGGGKMNKGENSALVSDFFKYLSTMQNPATTTSTTDATTN